MRRLRRAVVVFDTHAWEDHDLAGSLALGRLAHRPVTRKRQYLGHFAFAPIQRHDLAALWLTESEPRIGGGLLRSQIEE